MRLPWSSRQITLGSVDPALPLLKLPKVRLSQEEQRYHCMVLGKSGLGKSKMLQNVFLQHLALGQAVGLIDPHHDLSLDILTSLIAKGFFRSEDAYRRLVYIDWGNDRYVPFNILEGDKKPHSRALDALDGMIRVWPSLTEAPMFQRLFLDSMITLIGNGLPITYLYQLLTDPGFRRSCLMRVSDPLILQTFASFETMRPNDQVQAANSTLNRAHALTFSPLARNTLGQPDNALPFRRWMDQGVSFIMNLGNISDSPTRTLIGAMLMVQIEQAALSRTDIPQHRRVPLTLLADEWANFASQDKTISSILSQTRKFNLSVWLAGQSLSQISSEQLSGALENCKLLINYGLGRESAVTQSRQIGSVDPLQIKEEQLTETQHNQFYPVLEQFEALTQELQNLPRGVCYVKKHDGEALRVKTVNVPTPQVDPDQLDQVLSTYKELYQRSEQQTQEAIATLSAPLPTAEPEQPQATPAYRQVYKIKIGDRDN